MICQIITIRPIKVGDTVKIVKPFKVSAYSLNKILKVTKVEPEIDCYTMEDGQIFFGTEIEKVAG